MQSKFTFLTRQGRRAAGGPGSLGGLLFALALIQRARHPVSTSSAVRPTSPTASPASQPRTSHAVTRASEIRSTDNLCLWHLACVTVQRRRPRHPVVLHPVLRLHTQINQSNGIVPTIPRPNFDLAT